MMAAIEREVIGEPWTLDDPEGWARFTCEECDKQLRVGDKVVMVPICGGWLCHPAHYDRRKCRR